MKKTIALLIGIALLASCTDKINQQPISQISVDTYYKSAADIDGAVTGAYQSLALIGQYGLYYAYLSEVRSDNSQEYDLGLASSIFSDIDLFRDSPSSDVFASAWRDNFIGIQRCNVILNRIGAIAMDATTKTVRAGEVKFLRALMYFNLVRTFGDVPLVLTETVDPKDVLSNGRTPKADVYKQIVSDLTDAANSLPAKQSQVGRATQGAASALLGKVYLTLGQYANAIVALRAVTGYSLLNGYGSVFGVANKNSAESIFEVQFKKGTGSAFVAPNGLGNGLGTGSAFTNFFMPPSASSLIGTVAGQTMGSNQPTEDFINSYESGDLRKDLTIGYLGTFAYCKKFLDSPSQPLDADVNWIVLRYADVILMLAEALNEQEFAASGKPFDLINSIRNRAGLSSLNSTSTPNQASFRLAIENERRHELAFEGHRWFDLLRTNRALIVMRAHTTKVAGSATLLSYIQDFRLLYPVPLAEINANPGVIKPNTGY